MVQFQESTTTSILALEIQIGQMAVTLATGRKDCRKDHYWATLIRIQKSKQTQSPYEW